MMGPDDTGRFGRASTGALALCLAILLSACARQAEAPASATDAVTADVLEASAPPAAAPSARAATPTLQVTTLDGAPYELAERRGHWVVVNFWATWCAPCLKEMPELSALDAMHEHIEVIGLAYESIEAEAMRDFLERHPVVYPVAIVDTYAPPEAFDTPRGLPMTYLIAPDGKIADQFLGPVTAHDIEAAIAAAGGPAGNEAAAAVSP